jgi:hypothetical protein
MPHPRCSSVAVVVTGLIVMAQHEISAQTASKSSARNAITVIGCLRSADDYVVGTSGGAARAGTSGTTGRSANDSSTKFILTESMESSSSAEAVGTSGTTSTGYRLDGDASQLMPHVGRKVEISGTIANPGSTSVMTESVLSSAPRLKVASVRTIASTCGR